MKNIIQILILAIFASISIYPYAIKCEPEKTVHLKGLGEITPMYEMPNIEQCTNIELSPGINKIDIEVNKETLLKIFKIAWPINNIEEIKKYDNWSYASWFSGKFRIDDKIYSFGIYLGGLGVLKMPDETKILFRFEQKKIKNT